jgi:hypothetical protein
MKTAAIAAAIKRDLLRDDDKPASDITECFSCGRGMMYRGNRFCSARCRDWYDAGNPGRGQDWLHGELVYRWRDGRPMQRGPQGFLINCAHCSKQFDSKGLRCCSKECERAYRDRQDNLAVMAEVGIEAAAKRPCANPDCGQTIPKWRKGRKVSAKTRFCSPKCANRTRTLQTIEMDANT